VLATREPIAFLCPDQPDGEEKRSQLPDFITIEPIAGSIPYSDPRLGLRFGSSLQSPGGWWQAFHLEAFSQYFVPEILEQLYQFVHLAPQGDPIQDFGAYLDRVMVPDPTEAQFFQAWDSALATLAPGTTLVLEGYTALGLARSSVLLPQLRSEKGIRVVLRLRESLSAHWCRFGVGRGLLACISGLDKVAVHTDLLREGLTQQLEALHLPVPKVVTYHGRIDDAGVAQWSQAITLENFRVTIPGFESLQVTQQQLLEDALQTRHSVSHRFLVADGCDGIKGLWQTLNAIEMFLTEELEQGCSLTDLQQRYRFYLVQYLDRGVDRDVDRNADRAVDPIEATVNHPVDRKGQHDRDQPIAPVTLGLNQHYTLVCAQVRSQLERKFPGIVLTCDALRGQSAVALYGIMPFTNLLSGSTGDGLHQLAQEAAYANFCQGAATGTILGSAAGFAQQTQRDGGADLAWFPPSGNIKALAEAIRSIVHCQITCPERLRDRNQALVKRHILNRGASLFDL
jgi:hypothetical protein